MSYVPLSDEQRERLIVLVRFLDGESDYSEMDADSVRRALAEIDHLRSELAAAMTVVDAARKYMDFEGHKWELQGWAEIDAARYDLATLLAQWARTHPAGSPSPSQANASPPAEACGSGG